MLGIISPSGNVNPNISETNTTSHPRNCPEVTEWVWGNRSLCPFCWQRDLGQQPGPTVWTDHSRSPDNQLSQELASRSRHARSVPSVLGDRSSRPAWGSLGLHLQSTLVELPISSGSHPRLSFWGLELGRWAHLR